MMSVIKNKWTYKVFSSISPGGSWRQEVEEFSPFCQKKPEITFLQFPISLFFYNFYNFNLLSEKASDSISRFLLFPQFHLFVRKSPRKHFYHFLFLFLQFHLFCQKKPEITFVQFQLQLTSSDSYLSVHNTLKRSI